MKQSIKYFMSDPVQDAYMSNKQAKIFRQNKVKMLKYGEAILINKRNADTIKALQKLKWFNYLGGKNNSFLLSMQEIGKYSFFHSEIAKEYELEILDRINPEEII